MVSLLLAPESTPNYVPRQSKVKMTASKSHNYTLTMQEYMDLQGIRDELSSRLDQIRPGHMSAATSNSSTFTSPSTSPTRSSPSLRRHSRSGERRHRKGSARRSGWDEASETLDTIPDEETMEEISAEERRLYHVDESIKRALTELLNCESVRGDRSMRLWVQSRLMETEKELRSGRRRRSSGTE